jgi:recombinational DNA repair protein (RecF pathway)
MKRCAKCQKKVGLVGVDCACGNIYCSNCRHAETHQCTFDYAKKERARLIKENPKIIAQKIEVI